MYIALYIIYALVQAIVIARYVMKEQTAPVLLVFLLSLFAPIVSIIAMFTGIGEGIKWLVTYRPSGEK
jgi:hypothetical protein